MSFANFLRRLFKQHAVAARDCRSRQVRIFIFTAAQQAEEFSLLLLSLVAGTRSGAAAGAGAGGLLQASVDSRAQLRDRLFQAIHVSGIKLLSLVVLGFEVVDFGSE